MDEREEFALIRGGMQVLNFENDHIWNVFKIVAAVLNLGNITFIESERGNMPVSTVRNKDALRNAAALLEVSCTPLPPSPSSPFLSYTPNRSLSRCQSRD